MVFEGFGESRKLEMAFSRWIMHLPGNKRGTRRPDLDCKIKETLLIRELQPALNENVGSEKLLLNWLGFVLFCGFQTEVSLSIYFFIFLNRYQSLTLRLSVFVIFPTVTSEDVC